MSKPSFSTTNNEQHIDPLLMLCIENAEKLFQGKILLGVSVLLNAVLAFILAYQHT